MAVPRDEWQLITAIAVPCDEGQLISPIAVPTDECQEKREVDRQC